MELPPLHRIRPIETTLTVEQVTSEEEAVRHVRQCERAERARRRRLTAICGAGFPRRKKAIRGYLHSATSRIAALSAALRDRGCHPDQAQRPDARGHRNDTYESAARRWRAPRTHLELIAAAVNLERRVSLEPIGRREVERQEGAPRLTLVSGPARRATELLVDRALRASATLSGSQYLFKGGATAAVSALTEALDDGYSFVLCLDVRDAFGSLNHEAVEEGLPIPRSMVSMIARLGPHHTQSTRLVAERGTIQAMTEWDGSRRGIPQGSACSPIIFEMMFAPVLDQIASLGVDCRVFAYADDVRILVRTRREGLRLKSACKVLLEEHCAGPFYTSECRLRTTERPFSFVGHRISRPADMRTQVRAPRAALAKIRREFKAKLRADLNARRWQTEGAYRVLDGYRAAYRLCLDVALLCHQLDELVGIEVSRARAKAGDPDLAALADFLMLMAGPGNAATRST